MHEDYYSQYSMISINKTCALTSAQLFATYLKFQIRNIDGKMTYF